jgi:hypothetical protein
VDKSIACLTLLSALQGYLTIGLALVFAILGAVIGWKSAGLFMPLCDNWTKSYFSTLTFKIGEAIAGGYFSVMFFSYLTPWLFGK